MSKIDFERAKLLMDVIVAAGQHGQAYQKISGVAVEELKAMVEKEPPKPVEVRPEPVKSLAEPAVRFNPHTSPTEGRTR